MVVHKLKWKYYANDISCIRVVITRFRDLYDIAGLDDDAVKDRVRCIPCSLPSNLWKKWYQNRNPNYMTMSEAFSNYIAISHY